MKAIIQLRAIAGLILLVSTLPVFAQAAMQDATAPVEPSETIDSDVQAVQDIPQEDPQDAVDAEDEIAITRYTDEVQRIEREYSPYDNALIEQLIGLGHAFGSTGNHTEALKAFERALHVSRINYGLHSTDQLPVLESIIETNTALGNFGELAKNHNYLLWVHTRNHGGNNHPDMVPVINRVAAWNLQAYNHIEPPLAVEYLVNAARLFQQSYQLLAEQHGSSDNPALIAPLYGIFNAYSKLLERFGFLSANRIWEIYDPLVYSHVPEQYKGVNFLPKEFSKDDLESFAKQEPFTLSVLQGSYKVGRDVIEEIVRLYEVNPDLPRTEYVTAMLQLADWYTKFDQLSRAVSTYQQVNQFVAENNISGTYSSSGSSANRLHPLGAVIVNSRGPLATLDMTGKSEVETDTYIETELKEKVFILAEFDISPRGSVHEVRIIRSNPDEGSFRSRIRRKIQFLPFRPRLEDGKPIKAENVRILYTFEG